MSNAKDLAAYECARDCQGCRTAASEAARDLTATDDALAALEFEVRALVEADRRAEDAAMKAVAEVRVTGSARGGSSAMEDLYAAQVALRQAWAPLRARFPRSG